LKPTQNLLRKFPSILARFGKAAITAPYPVKRRSGLWRRLRDRIDKGLAAMMEKPPRAQLYIWRD
jgi:hypothetical protein